MATVGLIVGIVGAVAGVAGTALSFIEQKKAGKDQKRAEQARQQAEENQLRRQRRQAVREAQIKRAQIANFAEGLGIGGSSSPEGAVGSIGAQLGTNLGGSTSLSASNAKIGMFQQKALDHQQKAGLFGALGNFGFSASSFGFGNLGGSSALGGLAGSGTTGGSGMNSIFPNAQFGSSGGRSPSGLSFG